MTASSPSAVDRAVGLRCRADLLFASAAGGGRIATDPIGRTHHELTEEEAWLLEALSSGRDRAPSLRTLCREHDTRFAPRRCSEPELSGRLARLYQAGLLLAEGPGQGDALWRRRTEQSRHERRWAWARLLAIRIPGVNAQAWLRPWDGVARWLFSPLSAVLAILLWTIALLLLLGSIPRLVAELPSLSNLATSSRSMLMIVGCMAVLKTLHELGHALACRRFGAEVREMGLMLLMFTPCLYCDVTDAWRLPSRWRRAVITSAGVLVELSLAALATVVWRFSEPGIVHQLALNTMLVASLGTLLVNLNPLMRFDGYYLLSDLTDTPNLWGRSRTAVMDRITGWFRTDLAGKPREPVWLALYGVASQLFLWAVIGALAWLLLIAARSAHVEVFGWAIVLLIGLGLIAPPIASLSKWLLQPRHAPGLRYGRAATALLVGIALLGSIALLPLPDRVSAPAMLVPAGAEVVAVTLAGRLVEVLPAGTQVEAGDPIARLESPPMQRRIATAQAELASYQLELELLTAQRGVNPTTTAQLPTAKARTEDCERRLESIVHEADRLTIRAPRAGRLLAPPRRAPSADSDKLSGWVGNPMEPNCLGAWLAIGDVIGWVASDQQWEIELRVDETDTDRVAAGQPVRIALFQSPGTVLTGEVAEVARRSESSSEIALPTQYVRVKLNRTEGQLLVVEGEGVARIDVGTRSLIEQCTRTLRQTFRLP